MGNRLGPWRTAERIGWLGLLAAAFLLRSPRLSWQPLWWDEGYSVYFATEPLGRMTALTAQDIHPPLYYALLHLWLNVSQSVDPAMLRLLSVLIGVLAVALSFDLGRTLYPNRRRVSGLTVLLLTVNPLHIFYSQELRMYGLALAIGVAATATFWRISRQWEQDRTDTQPVAAILYSLAYIFLATAGLYTLYYFGLLLLAHMAWGVWHFHRQRRQVRHLMSLYLALALLYLPWLVYAAPKVVNYVAAKVPADADQPLGIITYLSRHLLAFTSGHLSAPAPALEVLRWLAVVALIGLFLTTRINRGNGPAIPAAVRPAPQHFLWSCLLIPTGLAFLINLRLPFFPAGGERLLLFALPYLLLLTTDAIDRVWQRYRLGPLGLALLLAAALAGDWTFFTTPRYTEHDYRPLISQIVQQSNAADTVLAIFPWEVGYWRAYAAAAACRIDADACTLLRGIEPVQGPAIQLVDDKSLSWGPTVVQALDNALAKGVLWFPAPLSFGSTLPAAIEDDLMTRAVSLENRWFTTTTRLSAWRTLPQPTLAGHTDDFGEVQLHAAGIAPVTVASANQAIDVALQWAYIANNGQPAAADAELGATVRLIDANGQTWVSRQYTPLGALAQVQTDAAHVAVNVDHVGLIIPAGLPPGQYDIQVGVVVSQTQALLQPRSTVVGGNQLIKVGAVNVTAPAEPQPAFRLPIQHALRPHIVEQGVAVLGYTLDGGDPIGVKAGTAGDRLAGEPVAVTLFLQNLAQDAVERELYVQLINDAGAVVAGWSGQSPAGWPSTTWPAGALIRAPIIFYTPATLSSGSYRLVAGLSKPAAAQLGAPITLTETTIRQRPASFAEPVVPHRLPEPVQFGAHAILLGYDQRRLGATLQVKLYWQVIQSLLPPHHIFVHLDTNGGVTVSQADGPPLTASGRAPSGSWQPGEYLVTEHVLPLADVGIERHFTVGLYAPESGVRLPATVNGEPSGDSAQFPLIVPPN